MARPTKKFQEYFMAQYEEFTIDAGADFAMELHLTNIDGSAKNLTNYVVTAKLKKNYNSDSDETYDFTTLVADPGTSGVVTLSLANTVTDNLKSGRYVYDVELSYQDSASNTVIERILEGRMQVTPSVTK